MAKKKPCDGISFSAAVRNAFLTTSFPISAPGAETATLVLTKKNGETYLSLK